MIQTEDFYKNMLVNLQDVSPYDSHIEKYERILGLNSVWLLPSLGSLLLFMGFYPLMLIAYFLLFLLNKCWPYVGRLKIKLKDIVFWILHSNRNQLSHQHQVRIMASQRSGLKLRTFLRSSSPGFRVPSLYANIPLQTTQHANESQFPSKICSCL